MSRNQGTRSVGSIAMVESRENMLDEVDASNDDVFVSNCQSQAGQNSRSKASNSRATQSLSAKDGKQVDFYCLSLRERISSMFLNEELADVHFLVGSDGEQTRFAAHRYVLALGSCVFRAMLYGDLSNESRTFEIRIPDIEPRAFYFVLRYLYTDEPEVEAGCAASIYYAAKKYLMDRLAAACVRVFEEDLVHSNACTLLANALLFDETPLADKCLRLVDAQAQLVLASDAFRSADRHIVATVLDRDTLVVPTELAIFTAVQRWSVAECERCGVEPTAENQRAVLDGTLGINDNRPTLSEDMVSAPLDNLRPLLSSLASNATTDTDNVTQSDSTATPIPAIASKSLLFKVRIPCIDLQDYANLIVPSGILTLQEISDVFMWQVASSRPAVPFNCVPRTGLPPHRCSRFQSCAHRRNQWRYSRGKCDAVAFTVDRPIYLFGIGLFGSSSGSCEYAVRVEIKQQLKQTAGCSRPVTKVNDTCKTRGSLSDGLHACADPPCSPSATSSAAQCSGTNALATGVHSNLIVHSTHTSVTINNPIFGAPQSATSGIPGTTGTYALLLQHTTKLRTDGSSSIFDVRFPHALQIAADSLYHVSVVLDGAELSYFGQDGLADVQCDDVTFQFHCSPDSSNGTGVQGGQIPALLFFS